MATYIDEHMRDLAEGREAIDGRRPLSGTCVFVDITNSTELKYIKGLKDNGDTLCDMQK